MSMSWRRTTSTDQGARRLADRHYSRKTVGSALFCPPGRKIILVLPRYRGLWITGYEAIRHDGFDAWTCNLFRNESGRLATVLIRQALAATLAIWHHASIPRDGLITFIDERRVQAPLDEQPYGWTFQAAGFTPIGRTKDLGLLILQISQDRLGTLAPRPVNWLGGAYQPSFWEETA